MFSNKSRRGAHDISGLWQWLWKYRHTQTHHQNLLLLPPLFSYICFIHVLKERCLLFITLNITLLGCGKTYFTLWDKHPFARLTSWYTGLITSIFTNVYTLSAQSKERTILPSIPEAEFSGLQPSASPSVTHTHLLSPSRHKFTHSYLATKIERAWERDERQKEEGGKTEREGVRVVRVRAMHTQLSWMPLAIHLCATISDLLTDDTLITRMHFWLLFCSIT